VLGLERMIMPSDHSVEAAGYTERLIGFDARGMSDEATQRWTPEQRNAFLLRTDVALPLSTDTLVWPSVFDTGDGIKQSRVPLPTWIGLNSPLWNHLHRMQTYLSERLRRRVEPYWVIAVTRLSGDLPRNKRTDSWPYDERTVPPARDTRWPLLGFDVSDGSMLSGLSGCGYLEEESELVQSLRRRWASQLNAHHLFRSWLDALEFVRIADGRVKEHAPFFVYGLYLINS